MKLWKVTGHITTIIASDAPPVEDVIREALGEGASNIWDWQHETPEQINCLTALPKDWDADCIPWGDGPTDATIADILSPAEEEL